MDLAVTGAAFEGTAFAETLEVDFGDSSESLSLDSEDESLLTGALRALVLVGAALFGVAG
jgi:hypothetical protein